MIAEISSLQTEVAQQRDQITTLSNSTNAVPSGDDLGTHVSRFEMADLLIGKLRFTEAKGIRPGQWISEPLDAEARVELRVNSEKIVQRVAVVLAIPDPADELVKKAMLEIAARCVTVVASPDIKFGQVQRMIDTVWGEDKLYADGLTVMKRGSKATCEVLHDFRTRRILVNVYPSKAIDVEEDE